jgi:phage terminase large subunit GpA-like protein
MKARARWVHEGQTIGADGVVSGERRRTDIASYWLGGLAAAYQRWDSIVFKYLQAVQTYVRTKDEKPLQATTNTDQAAAYLPRAILKRRGAEVLMQRMEDWPRGVAPAGVRFLTGAVDVQGNRFVVSVFGWGVDLESWLVDRFVITSSRRPEGDRFAALDPASYVEDWQVLVEQVVLKTYALDGSAGRALPLQLVTCDSGGREGVTEKAYEFWRWCRDRGFGRRFVLVKGVGTPNAARVHQTWPDSRGRKDRGGFAVGDVPVWLLNVNLLKDGVAGDLGRDSPGPGYHHIPNWVDPEYFGEITAETRTDKGWVRAPGVRNEAFDLHVYNRAACIMLQAEQINWQAPPAWAMPHEQRLPSAPTPAAPGTAAAPSRAGRRVRHPGIV